MAKAVFHKHQRVFVRPVGTWAQVEQVKPHWVKDVEEPVRVYYDCGLGRDFVAEDLAAEHSEIVDTGHWRLLRAKNKWQAEDECAHHPYPGTFPVVVTDAMDWGGWRVPAAEYDRDPAKMEAQARLLVNAPRLLDVTERLSKLETEMGEVPEPVRALIRDAKSALRDIAAKPADETASTKRAAA